MNRTFEDKHLVRMLGVETVHEKHSSGASGRTRQVRSVWPGQRTVHVNAV